MGSDKNHFNVALTVRDKITVRQCPQTTTSFERRESRSGIQPRPVCLPAYRLTARPNQVTVKSRFSQGLTLCSSMALAVSSVLHRNAGPCSSSLIIIIIIHSFYIALFSALEQTHCAHWQVILNEWLYPFIARIINIHGSGVLVALCGCCMAGATWNAAVHITPLLLLLMIRHLTPSYYHWSSII